MRRSACKLIVLAVCVLFIGLFAGCNEESLSDMRRSRLISAENRQLKKELKNQQEQLEKCLQEKEELREKMRSMQIALLDGNKKLREENQELKGQIEQLRKED
jgi:septal ring factor EnvC (AmiA/AmiB activator)